MHAQERLTPVSKRPTHPHAGSSKHWETGKQRTREESGWKQAPSKYSYCETGAESDGRGGWGGGEVLSRIKPKLRRRLNRLLRVSLSRERGNTHGLLFPPRVLYGFPHGARLWRGLGLIRDSTSGGGRDGPGRHCRFPPGTCRFMAKLIPG